MDSRPDPPKCTTQSVPIAEATEGREKVIVRVQAVEHAVLLEQVVRHVEERGKGI